MQLHGKHFIGDLLSAEGEAAFHGVDPTTGQRLEPAYHEATADEIDRAMNAAADAFEQAGPVSADRVAGLLEAIGLRPGALGDALIERAGAETGLSPARLTGERGRTVGQLKMFADLVREGSWVDARIDRALPDRKPFPRPDLRRMLIAIGPVVVFGASNFPLAFSVAGGDTASALAAGNPVVVKAHPAHPGTSEMVAGAIVAAVEAAKLPAGWFSMVHGAGPQTSLALVSHPAARAVGFTGSLRAGRAIYDAAAARPEPIPVYAEMGSTNPMFILPQALSMRGDEIAEGFKQSVTLGTGQFCTKPGMVFGINGPALAGFVKKASELIGQSPAATMLHEGIARAFAAGVENVAGIDGVRCTARGVGQKANESQASAVLFETEAERFLGSDTLRQEVFGPAALVVSCGSAEQLEEVARSLEGQLTATIHGTADDLARHGRLVEILKNKVGRLIFNGFPTGVEVSPAMNHGGPYPASSDVHFTSVGTAAIYRFARPICYQNFPAAALPVELRDENPRGIWRLVDGQKSRDAPG